MIQFLKGYEHKGRRFVIGQKVTLIPQVEAELVQKGIAQVATWDGKTNKIKTELFKPKKDGGNS